MEIRSIEQSDLIKLASLQSELINEETNYEKMLEVFALVSKDINYNILGAFKDNHLIGSLVGIVCHDIFGKCIPFMIVENVIISKKLRGQGIGTKLMNGIENIARERHCRYIVLTSTVERKKAKLFYHNLGYDSENYSGFKKYLQN